MSIIFDNLKKVKKRQPSTSVYPIINVKRKKNKTFLILIASLVIAIIALISFVIFTPIEKYKTTAVAEQKEKPEKQTKTEVPISYSRTTLPSTEVELKSSKQEPLPEKSTSKNKILATKTYVQPKKESTKVSLDIEKEFKSYLVKGDEAYLKGDLEKAINMYEKALRLKEDIPTYMTLLSIYALTGKVKKLEQILKYPDLYPWLDEDIVAITIKNLAESNFKGDISSLEKVALQYDEKGRVHQALGAFYEKRNKLALALHHYKQAYEKNPENPDYTYKFAQILQRTGDKVSAKQLYEKLLDMDVDTIFKKKIKVILKKLG